MATMNGYLTIQELSSYIQLPEETIYKYARDGRIPASKVGRYWRFERKAIDRWVHSHRNDASGDLRVLVVDDEPVIRRLMQQWLEDFGCVVDLAPGGKVARELIEVNDYGLIFLDLMMPEVNGIDVLKKIHAVGKASQVVIVTAMFDGDLMDEALRLGPLTLLKKPLEKEALGHLIESQRIAG